MISFLSGIRSKTFSSAIMIADEKVFDLIPLKKEIKAEVSGLYIVGVKGIRGSLQTPAPKKKGFFAKFKKDKTAR